jgi:hypothetical protein
MNKHSFCGKAVPHENDTTISQSSNTTTCGGAIYPNNLIGN